MSSWHLLKSESFSLAKKKALEFAAKHAALPHSPTERSIDPNRVKKLEAIIRNGLALPFQWATVEYGGQTLRENGQHSSLAIVNVGNEIPDNLAFHLDHFHADDRKGMVELFRQFDQRWSMRSSADVAGAFQGLVAEIATLDRPICKLGAEAISWCLRTVIGTDAPKGDNLYDIMHDAKHVGFFQWLNSIYNKRRELMKKEVIAAMFQTYEASETGSTKFWREVSFGPDFFTDDMMAGAVLIGELSKAREDKEYRAKEFETPVVYYKKAIKAWNAFCSGQRIATLKVTKGKGWPDVLRYGEEEDAA